MPPSPPDFALDRDVELVAAVAIDVGDQDLLRVALAEIGHHRSALALLGHVAHDLARLRPVVEAVRLARRGVDLEHAVAVEIADLDLVDEGVLLVVELDHLEAAVGLRPQHRHHALIVGRDGDRGAAIAVEVAHLGIAHAAELPAEVLLPERLPDRALRRLLPELHDRGAAAEAQQARPGRRSA